MIYNYQQILRNDGQRQFCHTDYSNSKKSDSGADHSIKSHSKKFSSTDLKNLNQRNSKGFESPKMSRSQLLPHKLKQDMRFKAKDMSNMQYSAIQTQRVRRQREYAKAGDKQETKLYNFSTSVGFSPNNNSLIFGDNDNAFHHQESHDNNNASSILKQHQNTKQKKKLEKKVATISKYISYYQNQAQALDRNIANQIIEEQANTKSNIVHFSSEDNASNIEDTARINNLSSSYSMKANANKASQPKIAHKLSYDVKNTHGNKDNSHLCKDNSKGKTEFIRSNCTSQHSDCESSQDNTYPRNCLTVKTLNKLLQNNEVSLHESNGSFMSLQQGQGSQYYNQCFLLFYATNKLLELYQKEWSKKYNPVRGERFADKHGKFAETIMESIVQFYVQNLSKYDEREEPELKISAHYEEMDEDDQDSYADEYEDDQDDEDEEEEEEQGQGQNPYVKRQWKSDEDDEDEEDEEEEEKQGQGKTPDVKVQWQSDEEDEDEEKMTQKQTEPQAAIEVEEKLKEQESSEVLDTHQKQKGNKEKPLPRRVRCNDSDSDSSDQDEDKREKRFAELEKRRASKPLVNFWSLKKSHERQKKQDQSSIDSLGIDSEPIPFTNATLPLQNGTFKPNSVALPHSSELQKDSESIPVIKKRVNGYIGQLDD